MVTKTNSKLFLAVLALVMMASVVNAQVGVGVDAATNEVKGLFANVSNLVLVIGGVVGLVGAIRVFLRWQNGEREIQKEIVGWLGACIFILLAGTIMKTMFGM